MFTLKKFISIFFTPLSIGFILLFLGLISLFNENYKKARKYIFISFIWFFLIGYSPFSNYLIQPLENQYKAYTKVDSSIKYILVLGHGHVTNEQMPSLSQLSSSALMRLSEGIRIFKQLDNAKLILSGYEGEEIKTPHAFVAKKVAISLGIPKEDILTLEEARDTVEEAFFAKKILDKSKFILITSAFHMPRAMKIFETAKLNPIAAPTDFLSKEDGDYLRMPRGKEIRKTELAMHEYLETLWHTIIQKLRVLVN